MKRSRKRLRSAKVDPEQQELDKFAITIRGVIGRIGARMDTLSRKNLATAATHLEKGNVRKAYALLRNTVAANKLPHPYHGIIRQIVHDLF